MKQLSIKYIGIMALAMIANIPTSTIQAGTILHTVSFDVSELTITEKEAEDGNTYSVVDWAHMYSTSEASNPELPKYYFRLLVPTYSNNFRVSISDAYIDSTIELKHLVYPAQECVEYGKYAEFCLPTGEAYKKTLSKPTARVVDENMFEGQYHTVTVDLTPICYNPQENKLDIYGKIDIELEYDECQPSDMKLAVNKNIRHSKYYDYKELVANYDDFEKLSYSNNPMRSTALSSAQEYYLIVAPQNLCDALQDLVVWKKQKGYHVDIIPLESILTSDEYKANGTKDREDDAASLRACLRDYYNYVGEHYFCLLVGDHKTEMPIRRIREAYVESKPTTDAYIPTDNYFANVLDDWKLIYEQENKQYVISDKYIDFGNTYSSYVDLQANIYIGRLLCHTAEQVKSYLNKLFLYEANPGRGDDDYLNTFFLFEQDANDKKKSLIGESKHVLKDIKLGMNVILYEDQSISEHIVWPTGPDVISQMSQSGISSWYGHGEPTNTGVAAGLGGWGPEWKLITARDEYTYMELTCDGKEYFKKQKGDGLNTLFNADKPSIVYSIGCYNAPFDIFDEDDRHFDVPYTMASSFTVGGDYGGPAFLGNTRGGYTNNSSKIENLFLKNILNGCNIGIAEAFSKRDSDWTSKYQRHVRYTHHLIGDPEFKVWLGKPEKLNLSIINMGSSAYITGDNYTDCRVSLYDGQNANYVIATNLNIFNLSNAVNSFLGSSPIYSYSVWKDGYLPGIVLRTNSGELTKGNWSFIVRKVIIDTKMATNSSDSFTIGDGANLKVKGIDDISVDSNVVLSKGGNLSLDCDNSISIKGMTIEKGGELKAKANSVVISGAFSVEQGGELNINN